MHPTNPLARLLKRLISPCWLIGGILLTPGLLRAQEYAPGALASGSEVVFSSTVEDEWEGTYQDTGAFSVTSATTFVGGTYTYTKTGPNTATLSYVANYTDPPETETATMQVVFTGYGVGTFNNAGSYFGNYAGTTFSGSFTSSGTFTYNGPTVSNVTDKSTAEDVSTGPIPFTVGDAQTAAASLSITRASSNTTLVPLANVVLGGSGTNRTVTITPAANQTGSSTITLTVSDGSLSASDTFVLTVTAVNDAPTISDVTAKSTAKGTSTGAIAFTIGDAETAATSLTVTRASSNTTLVPLANVVLGGSGASRTVTITPAANQTGTSTITLTVSDGVLTATDTFVLTVPDSAGISAWRQTYFASADNSGAGADLNDFDQDGMVNLLEFALGTDPKKTASAVRPLVANEVVSGQAYQTMTVTKPAGIGGITYLVEVSGTADVWTSGPAGTTVITDNATTLKVRDNTPATGGRRFIRLKVSNP